MPVHTMYITSISDIHYYWVLAEILYILYVKSARMRLHGAVVSLRYSVSINYLSFCLYLVNCAEPTLHAFIQTKACN